MVARARLNFTPDARSRPCSPRRGRAAIRAATGIALTSWKTRAPADRATRSMSSAALGAGGPHPAMKLDRHVDGETLHGLLRLALVGAEPIQSSALATSSRKSARSVGLRGAARAGVLRPERFCVLDDGHGSGKWRGAFWYTKDGCMEGLPFAMNSFDTRYISSIHSLQRENWWWRRGLVNIAFTALRCLRQTEQRLGWSGPTALGWTR